MSLATGGAGNARVPNADNCAELFRGLQPRLERILGRYQVPHADAEDLLQETFVLYLLRHGQVRNAEAWIIGTIQKRCIVHWRRRSLRASLLEPLRPEDLAGFSPVRSEFSPDDRLELEEALARLSPRDRRLLWLRYVVECSGAEIADALGITPESVRKLLLRARDRLRRVLADPTYTPQNTTQSHPHSARSSLR